MRIYATSRQTAKLSIVEAHERAGDVAREHDFHVAAVQHYQDALHVTGADSDAIERVTQKLIRALFLSGKPGAAEPLYERLLTSYLATPGDGARAVGAILNIARQLWIDARTKETIPILAQAIQIAEKIGDRELWIQANLVMCNYCSILGRYEEASQFLNSVGKIGNGHSTSIRVKYYKERAAEASTRGEAAKVYRYFQRILPIIEEGNSLYGLVTLWDTFRQHALTLGNIERAKAYVERALLVARQHNFIWYIPFLCLKYADVLRFLGQTSSAYGYLSEALSFDARAPILEQALAETGIPLALQMNDEVTLQKCTKPSVLTRVFKSGAPEDIGPVVANFAKFERLNGNRETAQRLLHEAVEVVTPVPYGWELPLEVARQGADADIPPARVLLEARTAFPHSAVPRTCLQLFDAYVAQREGNYSAMHVHARGAVKGFETLRWHLYADEARLLLPGRTQTAQPESVHSLPFADLQATLTVREQQVAGFVLRGMSNRAIASELSITENTVEKHMTAIMTRLGIRSRHQLAAAIENIPNLVDTR
jgi:DNA-binding CsgD family transcriptional regulator/tetratricopeptide (TPR) repeat protein